MAVCVLTGDIVGSTDLTSAQQRQVMDAVGQAFEDLADGNGPTFDTYRGDGWQMSFPTVGLGLRYALYIRALLRSKHEDFETRIAIAEHHGETRRSHRIATPFTQSGRSLDAMPDDVLLSHASGGPLQAATLLADRISRGWTNAQAKAIRYLLPPDADLTQKVIARHLGISRQAVGQALDAAAYPVIKRALAAIEGQAK